MLLAFSMPATSAFLLRNLHHSPTLDLRQVSGAQAIVILGGGMVEDAPEYGGAALGILTLQRVRYGARVARATGLPVLVSGGPTMTLPAEALSMRDALVDEYGVAVKWVEPRSRNTHENAVDQRRSSNRTGSGA